MTSDPQKLLAEAEEAERLAAKKREEAERVAKADAERKEAIEKEWYAAHEDEYYTLPVAISDARRVFIEAARSGDLQGAYTAWLAWQRVWSEQAAWASLLHYKLYGFGSRKVPEKPGHTVSGQIIAQRHGLGNFSKDLAEALHPVIKEDAAAYVSERTADLRAKVGK